MPRVNHYKWKKTNHFSDFYLWFSFDYNSVSVSSKRIDSQLSLDPITWIFCHAHDVFWRCILNTHEWLLGSTTREHVSFSYFSLGLISLCPFVSCIRNHLITPHKSITLSTQLAYYCPFWLLSCTNALVSGISKSTFGRSDFLFLRTFTLIHGLEGKKKPSSFSPWISVQLH